MGRKSSGSKVRYAVVGLGHIAQVAVLPAFKRRTELGTRRSGVGRSAKAESSRQEVSCGCKCSRMTTTIRFFH